MQKLHHYLVITLTVLSTIFILQNMQMVTVEVFFWELSMPRALLMALLLIIGIVIGLLRQSSKRSEAE
jgi:uncharacterized integral membrane protein